jgi:catechol 2,3-dioxygenase-like lactoylglutathione lyase family enzyme
MGVMRLGFVQLLVTDLEEARNHYSNTPGMAVVAEQQGREPDRRVTLGVTIYFFDPSGNRKRYSPAATVPARTSPRSPGRKTSSARASSTSPANSTTALRRCSLKPKIMSA